MFRGTSLLVVALCLTGCTLKRIPFEQSLGLDLDVSSPELPPEFKIEGQPFSMGTELVSMREFMGDLPGFLLSYVEVHITGLTVVDPEHVLSGQVLHGFIFLSEDGRLDREDKRVGHVDTTTGEIVLDAFELPESFSLFVVGNMSDVPERVQLDVTVQGEMRVVWPTL